MNALASALLGLGGGAAIIDWGAVGTGRRRLDQLAKPATLVLFLAAALALHPVHGSVRAWFVIGLGGSLAGDVFLLWPPRWFVAGLGSFLVGHLSYVVGFALEQRSPGFAILGLLVVIAGAAAVGRTIVVAVGGGDDPALVGPVVAYIAALSAMVITAWGAGLFPAVVGALLFYASDATLAWDRFVKPLRRGRLAVIVTYHLGQAGLVLSLARPLG
ncbi:MAG: lysoplasmalogenase [Actinomycetota bacterium]|nr:lysoplasmalogenase [Actinomycetota bacterium]